MDRRIHSLVVGFRVKANRPHDQGELVDVDTHQNLYGMFGRALAKTSPDSTASFDYPTGGFRFDRLGLTSKSTLDFGDESITFEPGFLSEMISVVLKDAGINRDALFVMVTLNDRGNGYEVVISESELPMFDNASDLPEDQISFVTVSSPS